MTLRRKRLQMTLKVCWAIIRVTQPDFLWFWRQIFSLSGTKWLCLQRFFWSWKARCICLQIYSIVENIMCFWNVNLCVGSIVNFFDNGSRVSGLWGFSWLGRDPKKHLPTVSLCISAMFLDEVDDQLIFLSSIQNTLHSLQIVCPRFCPGCNIPLDLQTFKAMKHNQVQQYFSQLNLCRV